ncbi:ANTAR domain-containing protein [Streptomyces sp. TRM49041]|uniref:ANTAR domain-containing protein n=1 Tax=Streptomyces sp. TRM49041 TaxID=2603216 RepID=UPI0021CCBE1B|nr:ANTAR domain-containing protein [Streptomyces sp. TRM49041]
MTMEANVERQDTPHRDAQPASGEVLIEQLKTQIAHLERAVESHAVIDQAMGVLMAVGGCSSSKVWDVLRETSMCTNTKLRHVAELVVHWAHTGNLPSNLRTELRRRLFPHTPTVPATTASTASTASTAAPGCHTTR